MFKEAAYWMYYFWSKERQGGYLQCHVDDGNPVVS